MIIGGRTIAHDAPTFIVAELSANHGHSLDVALRTIDAAALAGADAIKIQTYTPDTLTLDIDRDPFIVRSDNVWKGRNLHALYREAMTPWEWTDALAKRARDRGLAFFSTPFDVSALDFLRGKVDALKVASFELSDLPLVEAIAREQLPILLSTGMATLEEIRRAVQACRDAGNSQIALLRCVSTYPAKAEDMQLESLATLAALGVTIGLSDHTRDHTAVSAAVALGARVIEKHFILERSIGGPDAFFSLEPQEFSAMVAAVRATESALGVRFGPTPSERESLVFRRSLFVSREVAAGELLTCENVRSVRPGNGMPAWRLPDALGCRASQALTRGTPLQPEHIGARVPSKHIPSAAKEKVLVLRVDNEAMRKELVDAGFYHFRTTADGTFCERRIAPYEEAP
jgi:pseudaminic acid synthase